MKRWILLILVVVLLLTVPRGFFGVDQICTDCGKIRRSEQFWVFMPEWSWDLTSSDLVETPASRFIRKIGSPAQIHVWRASRTPLKAGRMLSQEEGLVGLDREIAWDAVRARLRNPGYDGRDPDWYAPSKGWPTRTLEETKAWWAGVPERGGSFSH